MFLKLFAEREIILRSNGRVRFLRLTRGLQMAAALLVVGGTVAAGYAGLNHRRELVELAREKDQIGNASLDYVGLISDVADYQRQVSAVTQEMAVQQGALLSLVEAGKVTKSNIGKVKAQLANLEIQRGNLAMLRQGLKRRLNEFQANLDAMSPSNETVARHLAILREKLESETDETDLVAAARDAVQRKLRTLQTEMRAVDSANAALKDSVSKLEASLNDRERGIRSLTDERDAIREQLETARAEIAALGDANSDLTKRFERTQARLKDASAERDALTETRQELSGRVESLRAELGDLTASSETMTATLADVRSELSSVSGARDALRRERDALREKISEAESTLSSAEEERREFRERIAGLDKQLAETNAAFDALRAREKDLARDASGLERRLADLTDTQIKILNTFSERSRETTRFLETTISLAGLKVDRMIAKAGDSSESGKGGPFFAAVEGVDTSEELLSTVRAVGEEMERADTLRQIVRAMPLAAPMDDYRRSSGFGKRIDPINGKSAMHYGLDFVAPRRKAVRATAPGKVVFSGWKGNYGRIVEIDHGFGIKTRYAHLDKILVKKGKHVDFRDKIGLLGSSGRSTGPHLHYEVSVNNRPMNPQKFLRAGNYVFKK